MEMINSTLAKLFSAENISIQMTNKATAAFDTKNRVMHLPMWITKLNPASKELLLLHEASHALHTPELGKHDVIKFKNDPLFATIYNIVEDKRIEDLMKEKFPGSVSTFNRGFFELVNQNFFGISFNQDPNELNFLDRANLHFKGDYYFPCNFDEEEQYWVERIEQSKTSEQVEQTVLDILEWLKEKFTDEILQEFINNYKLEIFSGEIGEGDILLDLTEEQLEALQEMFGDDDMEGIRNFIKSEFKDENSPFFQELLNKCESITEQNWENKTQELMYRYSRGENNTKTLKLLKDFDYKPFVVENEVVHYYLTETKNKLTPTQKERLQKYINDFKVNTKNTLQHMLREFFRKKAAEEYRRTKSAKTGNINLNKLNYYKFDEDLFLHKTIHHTEKNHAFVMLFDWSGSMAGRMESALIQLLINVSFCKTAGIPFVVYAFSEAWSSDSEIWLGTDNSTIRHAIGAEIYSQKADGIVIDPKLKLMEFINSQSKNYETQVNNLLMLALSFNTEEKYLSKNSISNQIPSKFYLSSTPLDDSMILMYYAMFDLKQKLNSEIVNLVVMTDGYSNNMRGYARQDFNIDRSLSEEENIRMFYSNINDCHHYIHSFLIQVERSKKIYDMRHSDKMEITAKLSKIIKNEHNVNTICIQLTEGSTNHIIGRIVNQFDLYLEEAEEYAKSYREKLSVSIASDGFDRLIYLNSKLFSEDPSDPDEYFDKLQTTKNGTYTSKQLTGAISRSAKVKKRRKFFVNSFIDIVSEKQ